MAALGAPSKSVAMRRAGSDSVGREPQLEPNPGPNGYRLENGAPKTKVAYLNKGLWCRRSGVHKRDHGEPRKTADLAFLPPFKGGGHHSAFKAYQTCQSWRAPRRRGTKSTLLRAWIAPQDWHRSLSFWPLSAGPIVVTQTCRNPRD